LIESKQYLIDLSRNEILQRLNQYVYKFYSLIQV